VTGGYAAGADRIADARDATKRLFDDAHKVHAAEIAKRHNAKLKARGRYERGMCPLCGSGKSSESFQAEAKGPLWHCFSCGDGGDGIKLEQLLGKYPDRIAAARVLAGELPRVVHDRPVRLAPSADRPEAQWGDVVDSAIVARHIWRTSVPAEGTIVEAWLRSRGLDPQGVPGAIGRLRFHPRCPLVPWRVGQSADQVRSAPAMIARIDRIDPTGRSPAGGRILQWCGVHATYLRADGSDKADIRRRDGTPLPGRKMWGSAKGAGFWLTAPEFPAPADLIVGEGIETVWSYAQDLTAPFRACAVLSLDNVQGGARKDAQEALPIWNPIADPERPPMLMRDPGRVVVLVDADMKPVTVTAQRRRGEKRGKLILSSLDRAELCARLATQHWRGAGAISVRCVRPAVGMDFNDAAMSAGSRA